MFYKPKYCCNCGEKIERTEWNMLTSRRFCESCALEKKRHDIALRVLAASGAAGLLFGIGNLWGSGRSEQTFSAVPVAARVVELPAPAKVQTTGTTDGNTVQNSAAGNYASRAAETLPLARQIGKPDAKFFCGALTKKGTPCSRKVRLQGSRCYQHEGKPSAPPQN